MVCVAPSRVRATAAPSKVIGTPPGNQDERNKQGERQQHEKSDPEKIEVKIADALPASQRARKGGKACDSCGSGDELQPHQSGKLGEIAHCGFSGIVLEVGVCDERRRGVEYQACFQRAFTVRVQRQPLLKGKYRRHESEHHHVEHEHGDEVLLPVLFTSERVSSCPAEKFRCPASVEGCSAGLDQMSHNFSERPGQQGGNDDGQQQ